MLRADEAKEPPVKYRLEVNGKAYPLVEGEPIKLTGTLTNPTVKLVAEPYRDFAYGGVTFQYPRAFTFEADVKDPQSQTWIMSGNDFKIMYFRQNEKVTSDDFADAMIAQFGTANAKKSAMNSEVLGQKINGTRLNLTLGGHLVTMDILCLPFAGGTRIVVLHDNPKGADQSSAEAREALSVLKKTWAVK